MTPSPARPRPQAGPVVWAGILLATCALLVLASRVLFLVVPFLLALLSYYLLMGPVRALMTRGQTREQASAWVCGVFTLLVALASLWALPWMASGLDAAPEIAARYLHGGLGLMDRMLLALEERLPSLARANLAEEVGELVDLTLSRMAERHVAPLALTAATWAPYLLLTPFIGFYLLREGHRFERFLAAAVPNAFFERTLTLLNQVDRAARSYFSGLLKLTVLDTVTLALGLWLLGLPQPLLLGLLCAVMAWVPYVGSIAGGLLVVLVAATDFPGQPQMAFWAAVLFGMVRLLDDFVYMPLTIGRSLSMHPVIAVVMIFTGGALAGVPGLMLVLPVLGVVMVVGETLGTVLTDARLVARWRHGRRLARSRAEQGL